MKYTGKKCFFIDYPSSGADQNGNWIANGSTAWIFLYNLTKACALKNVLKIKTNNLFLM